MRILIIVCWMVGWTWAWQRNPWFNRVHKLQTWRDRVFLKFWSHIHSVSIHICMRLGYKQKKWFHWSCANRLTSSSFQEKWSNRLRLDSSMRQSKELSFNYFLIHNNYNYSIKPRLAGDSIFKNSLGSAHESTHTSSLWLLRQVISTMLST